ncbi:MAG: L-lysine 6-transaminase [Crenarchaeota archaeon]|nr:MAG: L-lysine 6-transaminase [Thermoproteota archaeon]
MNNWQDCLVPGNVPMVDFKSSNGSWMVDVNGNKYLDCHAQYASQALGWNHPALLNIDYANVVKLANPDFHSEIYMNFVKAFKSVAYNFKKFFFIDGGTLGVENALKAAFDWKSQKLGWDEDRVNELDVVHFKQAFHGRSGYTLSLTNTDPKKTRLFPKFNWTRVHNPKIRYPILDESIYQEEADSLNHIEDALKRNNVAAVLLEPIQGEGGDNHFRDRFLQELRKLVDRYETMLVFDEVQTGLGMTGEMWCHEHFGVVPDLMAFGKKTQVCGFCATEKIDEIEHNVLNTPYRICSTWGGNTLDMLRATEIIKAIVDEGLVDNAYRVGNYLLNVLREIPGIFNVRGRGLMIAFDLTTPDRRDEVLTRLREHLLILPCGEKSIRLRPHLTISQGEAELVFNYIRRCV